MVWSIQYGCSKNEFFVNLDGNGSYKLFMSGYEDAKLYKVHINFLYKVHINFL